MTRRVINLISVLALTIAGIAVAGAPASAAESAACDEFSLTSIVRTYGDPGQRSWGGATTVHSSGCNHWGNVALTAPLPSGYQVNVTLTRYDTTGVVDRRYCYVHAGGKNCHTPAVLTTSCIWSYTTKAEIYIWNGGTWAILAWSQQVHSRSCQ